MAENSRALESRWITVYWLWLVIAFCVLALIPFWPDQNKLGEPILRPAHLAYSHPWYVDWLPIILVHALSTFALASAATVVHELLLLRRGSAPVARVFSLLELLIATGVMGLVFGLLRWRGAPAVFYFVVLFLAAGRPLLMVLTTWLARFLGLGGGGLERTDH